MTTKPKARKFRIRRSGQQDAATTVQPEAALAGAEAAEGTAAGPAAAQAPRISEPRTTGGENMGLPATPKAAEPAPPARPPRAKPDAAAGRLETDIEAIRSEGLTGRQLRLARRMAQRHDLAAASDFDAVRLLRARGIDPFQRSSMLEMVVPNNPAGPGGPAGGEETAEAGRIQLPQTVPEGSVLPAAELSPAERRNQEIQAIQRDLARRRRRKLVLLLARLAFFVMLPTAIAGYYYYKVAAPMYAAKSEFLVLKAENAGGAGLGGLLSGTQFATSQDSIAVQSYLQSKEAMLRLDRELGFKAHFTQSWIDPIQRLNPDPTNEEAYRTYTRNVRIGYDPTEGVIRMEVSAADPEVSAEFSRRLISYAQEKVNHLSEQKRADQMGDAEAALDLAEAQRRDAQQKLVQLQQQGAVLDPDGVIASLRSQISSFELQLQEKQLELAALMDNARPNSAKVDGARADITRLEAVIARLNTRMTDASAGENSLASLSVKIQMAQADLATRDMMLQSALQQVEQTRMEANRQVRYLTTAVEPVPSEEPSYPRRFENTILAFLIFSGIYLMCSLTASILREQVSS